MHVYVIIPDDFQDILQISSPNSLVEFAGNHWGGNVRLVQHAKHSNIHQYILEETLPRHFFPWASWMIPTSKRSTRGIIVDLDGSHDRAELLYETVDQASSSATSSDMGVSLAQYVHALKTAGQDDQSSDYTSSDRPHQD